MSMTIDPRDIDESYEPAPPHPCEQRLREYLLTESREVRLREPGLAADLRITPDELRDFYEACRRAGWSQDMSVSVVDTCLEYVKLGHEMAAAE